MLDKKFDVVMSNVPFNDDKKNIHGNRSSPMSQNVAANHTNKMLDVANDYVVAIQPYNTKSLRNTIYNGYRKRGMYKIRNVSDYFNITSKTCYIVFDKNNYRKLDDQFPPRNGVNNNLVGMIRDTRNRDIGGYIGCDRYIKKKQLMDMCSETGGKHKLWVSSSTIVYMDDINGTIFEGCKVSMKYYRVCFDQMYDDYFDKVYIAEPGDLLGFYGCYIIVESKEQAIRLKAYLQGDYVQGLLKELRPYIKNNTGDIFKQIPKPEWI